jgi:hypothetical protein
MFVKLGKLIQSIPKKQQPKQDCEKLFAENDKWNLLWRDSVITISDVGN